MNDEPELFQTPKDEKMRNAVAKSDKANQSPVVVPATTPMQALINAMERGASTEQISQMMDLQDRWEKREAKKAYDEAFTAFKADPPTLIKNKAVGYGKGDDAVGYKHAELDQVASVIGAALSKHGLSHKWKTEQLDGGFIRVTCVISHVQGHSESIWLQASPDSSGKKNNIQAIGSTVTYLERYTLLGITGLAAKNQDDDGKKSETVSQDQADAIQALQEDVGANKAKFLKYFSVGSFAAIPANQYDNAMALLEAKRNQS